MFSVVKGALLDPWPYRESDRIVTLRYQMPEVGRTDLPVASAPEVADLMKQTDVFEHVLAGVARNVNLMNGPQPERVRAAAMTASAWDMLGVRPLLGRTFAAEDDAPGAAPVVVLSYRFWKNRLGGDSSVLGKTLEIEGAQAAIVGVMPERFVWWDRELWMPLRADFATAARTDRNLYVQGTVRAGLSREKAEAALRVFANHVATEHPEVREYRGYSIRLEPLLDDVLRDARPALIALLCAVLVLLAIGGANVASMMLAQASARQTELAVRSALGARPSHIARQLVTEGLLLSIAGGAAGALIAAEGVRLVAAWLPYGYIPAEADLRVDAVAALFSAVVTIAVGVGIGWAPTAHVFRTDLFRFLREGSTSSGARTRKARTAFLTSQVALAVVVLAGAALLLESFHRIAATDRGFRAANVLLFRLPLAADRHQGAGEAEAMYGEILRRVRGTPGVESAAYSAGVAVGEQQSRTFRATEDAQGEGLDADFVPVSPDYFRVLGIPVLHGRAFEESDRDGGAQVAVVNQAMAARLHLSLGSRMFAGGTAMTVVGIAGNVRGDRLLAAPRPAVFVPWTQAQPPPRNLLLLTRTAGDPAALLGTLRHEVAATDPTLPIYLPQTLEEAVSDLNGPQRLAAALLSAFALIALLLCATGIAAAVAQSVAQRRAEIAVRIALGARTEQVLQTVMRDAVRVLSAGLCIGLALSLAATRVLSGLLFGVSPVDPKALAATVVLLSAAVLFATWLPARRACAIDSAGALR
jgi:putative ABC transport system permease protein